MILRISHINEIRICGKIGFACLPKKKEKYQESIVHLIEMFSVNLPHAARSRLAERTRLDRILASWGGLALGGAARSPGPTGERWSGRWRCGLLVFRGDLCVVEVLLSVRLLWAPTVSDNVICLALSRLSYLIYAFVRVDVLTPGEECECAVSFRPVMSTFSHSRATDTCTLPCSSSVRKKVTQPQIFLIHPQVQRPDCSVILTLHLLASSSSHAVWSSSMCSPSSVGWLGLLSISVTDGEGAGLTLPWSQLQYPLLPLSDSSPPQHSMSPITTGNCVLQIFNII